MHTSSVSLHHYCPNTQCIEGAAVEKIPFINMVVAPQDLFRGSGLFYSFIPWINSVLMRARIR
jgi:hypothetical protein